MTIWVMVSFYAGVVLGFVLSILLTASRINEQEKYIAQLLKRIKE